MAHDLIQIDADRAALHRYLREAEHAINEAHAMKTRLETHLDQLLEDNRRLTADNGMLSDQLQCHSTG